MLNQTKNLQIKNTYYDSYTHEYLGDYLRFQRDYNNTDLMPLYNCFSNRIVNNLSLSIDFFRINSEGDVIETKAEFDSYDDSFKIYAVPVKLFKEYTIAMECDFPVEICCALYNKVLDTRDKVKHLSEHTYQKLNKIVFSQPILYTKLTEEDLTKSEIDEMEIAQQECNLRLIIKIPASIDTTITILEGNYLNYNDRIYSYNSDKVRWELVNN